MSDKLNLYQTKPTPTESKQPGPRTKLLDATGKMAIRFGADPQSLPKPLEDARERVLNYDLQLLAQQDQKLQAWKKRVNTQETLEIARTLIDFSENKKYVEITYKSDWLTGLEDIIELNDEHRIYLGEVDGQIVISSVPIPELRGGKFIAPAQYCRIITQGTRLEQQGINRTYKAFNLSDLFNATILSSNQADKLLYGIFELDTLLAEEKAKLRTGTMLESVQVQKQDPNEILSSFENFLEVLRSFKDTTGKFNEVKFAEFLAILKSCDDITVSNFYLKVVPKPLNRSILSINIPLERITDAIETKLGYLPSTQNIRFFND